MHARPRRGLVSRPSLIEVLEYREQVDARMAGRFEDGDLDEEAARVVLLGTHHEQQHQELLLTDIKHALGCNPLGPDRKSVVRGKSESVCVDLGGRRMINKKKRMIWKSSTTNKK